MTKEQIVNEALKRLSEMNPFDVLDVEFVPDIGNGTSAHIFRTSEAIDLCKRPDGVWELPK